MCGLRLSDRGFQNFGVLINNSFQEHRLIAIDAGSYDLTEVELPDIIEKLIEGVHMFKEKEADTHEKPATSASWYKDLQHWNQGYLWQGTCSVPAENGSDVFSLQRLPVAIRLLVRVVF